MSSIDFKYYLDFSPVESEDNLIKGYQRHMLVDSLGLVLMVIITAANTSGQRGAKILVWKTRRQGKSLGRLVRI